MLLHHITTSWPGGVRRQERGCVPFRPDAEGRENDLINLYPRFTDQIWEGFGGAVTDSAGFVYSLMAPEQRETFLRRCFDPDGLGYRLVRVPVDSCDFSLETYEAAPGGDLGRFSMERAGRYILPLLEDIRRTAPHPVRLILSPWSPPAAFKSNGERCHGGRCLRQYWQDWAEYLCRYIEEFEARGFEVARISLQNEPKAVQDWDSCLWSAEEERDFLVQEMKPALLRHGLDRVEVFLWDHNKERVLDRALAILDEEAGPCADGSLLLVVLNRTGQGQDRFLRLEEQLAPQTFPAHSLTTLLITPDGVQPL